VSTDAEDVQTMLRLKGGDDCALNDLMSRWQKPVTAFILRYTSHEQDALDLAQETFLRVFESRERYEPRSKFSTWLYTIAANLCHNRARWRERHPTVSLHDSGEDDDPGLESSVPAPGDTPADSAERHDIASAVREHIQELPHGMRTVVLLFEYQDLGYEEIGATLGCTAKAVETRLYRARKILRELLAHWKI
jgi:RNA polymerase sigma factor (sigma-70 family)